jgi:PAS domain S-box-containing protein
MTPEILNVMENLPFPISFAETSETPIRVAFINKAFKRMFGYELEEIADINDWARLAYPDEAYRHEVMDSWNRAAQVAFETQSVIPIREVEIHARDGTRVRTLLNGSFVGTSVVVAFIDISQQARAEAELHDVRQMLERTAYELTENLPVGTYTMVQPPDGGLGQFRFMSPRFLEITGLTRDEVQRDPLRAFTCIHPDDYDRWLELNRDAFENKAAFFGEARISTKDQIRWIAAESKPRALEDGSTVWEGVLIDITDRKRAEESLERAKSRAEELERIKSDFLTRMSHEIRTPLTMMLGLTDLLADDCDRDSQAEKVTQLRNASNHLLGIVNDILDLSKIEAGQLITEQLPFSLPDLLAHVQAFEASIIKPDLKLVVQHPVSKTPTLIGDQRRIEQVLSNLIGNAIKFTDSGQIVVTLAVTQNDDRHICLRTTIEDTGRGIPTQHMSTLFTPFMQGDTSIARQFGGTGLGLSISKELVELMGGRIGVHSVIDQGSTFWFELPLAIGEDEPATRSSLAAVTSATNATTQPLKGLRILVVDDSLSIRGLIRALLQREGAQVKLAENGAIAIEILQAHGQVFDCVMMDVQMPIIDGLSATRQIRQMPQLDQLPILAMTAGLLAEQQVRAREAGMADVVAKPVDRARMVEQILRAVGKQSSPIKPVAVSDNPMPAIAGIDRHHANRTMDGSLEMFDLLANVFAQEFSAFEFQMSALLADRHKPHSRTTATRLAHSLRGSARQLGAIELSDAAAALETSIEAGANDCVATLKHLTPLLDVLIKSLKRYQQTQ